MCERNDHSTKVGREREISYILAISPDTARYSQNFIIRTGVSNSRRPQEAGDTEMTAFMISILYVMIKNFTSSLSYTIAASRISSFPAGLRHIDISISKIMR